jgi:hypothetical protein
MIRLIAAFLLLFSALAFAGESPLVDERLAEIVEGAVKVTGFSINISESTEYSVNINTINRRNVCDKEAAGDVKRFQDAVGEQPNVRNNHGPAYYSVTRPDGTRKVLSPEQLIKQGVLKGCTNIYVSVTPK